MGLNRISKDTEILSEKLKLLDGKEWVFCKTVFYKESYFNISYKKALRLLKKSTRKMFLRSVKHWEKVARESRYHAYFHREGKHISFECEPILFQVPPKPVYYFGGNDEKI